MALITSTGHARICQVTTSECLYSVFFIFRSNKNRSHFIVWAG